MTEPLLKTDLTHLPPDPGVYWMKDAAGEVLYVGKAVSLRQRVRQYFQGRGDGRTQVPWLVRRVVTVEVQVTSTEREALLLENNLIKKYQPRYNVRLKDDKTWLSVKVSTREAFPKVYLVRKRSADGGRYFGPYLSDIKAREVVGLIQKTFPLRTCTDAVFRAHSERPCLEYQIGNCSGPCAGLISGEGYLGLVNQVLLLLEGKNQEVMQAVKGEMEALAAELRFEEAARLRDRLRSLEKVVEKQRVQSGGNEDRDLWGYHREGDGVAIALIPVRDGKMQDARAYTFRGVVEEDAEILTRILLQAYEGGPPPPSEVLLPVSLPDGAVVEELLGERAGRRVTVSTPQRGEKTRMVELACRNAQVRLNASDSDEARRERGLAEIQRALSLQEPPRRMECYDMSNISGTHPVGSMVTFLEGAPWKAGYRIFKIKTVVGPDDYASMKEVLSRRFARVEKGWDLPDLIVIDGGRGQLRMAQEAAREVGVAVPLCSLAKPDDGEGERNPEGVDKVFLPGRKNPIVLPSHSRGLHLLQHIRDEAHRFGVHHHRQQRTRSSLTSRVDAVPGVGEERARALLRHFGSWKRLMEAGMEEIAQVEGIGRKTAQKIWEGLRKDE